jgi:hypothetical protein
MIQYIMGIGRGQHYYAHFCYDGNKDNSSTGVEATSGEYHLKCLICVVIGGSVQLIRLHLLVIKCGYNEQARTKVKHALNIVCCSSVDDSMSVIQFDWT